jgi:hypothetical protein
MFGTFSPEDIKTYVAEVSAAPDQADANSNMAIRLRGCVIIQMQGGPAQIAAITSIGVLGCRYSVLRDSAMAALREMMIGGLGAYASAGLKLMDRAECQR